MELSAKKIAELLNGSVEGDEEAVVNNVSKIESGIPNTLTFLSNPKYTKYIYTTKASVILVNKSFKAEQEIRATLIRVEDAYVALAILLDFAQKHIPQLSGIHELAYVAKSAVIGNDVYIAPFVYIGENAVVGDNTKIFPHTYIGDSTSVGSNCHFASGVKVYQECKIGNNCIFHSGVVVGSDGFGFVMQTQTLHKKIPQVGNVIIEDDVEIGANTTIDRAAIGSTQIKKGAKLDNLIQIAHGVEVGENTLICAQTGISGSTKVGRDCILGGQVGIVGHVQVADEVKIQAQSGVASVIKEKGAMLQGSPAFNIKEYLRSYVFFRRLPDMMKKIADMEKRIKELESK